MARISPDSIDRVREAADIIEVISSHTDLRRVGARFTGLCPFHDERTPSFSVDPATKLYYCFGCEKGGDVFRFVSEKEGLEFPDAVEALADRYGVELEREQEDPRAEEARRRRGRLIEALERAASFYASYLWEAPKAAKARDYLGGRGLDPEVLRAFSVGFAPSAWDQLLIRGQQAGFTTEELHGAGLIQRSQKQQGSHYDRFRARIVFPVRDPRGRVLGFGARAMGADSMPKYLNSPEGELYRKSRTLYGIDRARAAITRAGRAVVVEGYTDVLALHQAGIEEAVAVMGTAITPDQLGMLGGHCDEIVLALDADRAGREAMLRAQRVAGGRRLRLRVARMPPGEDPADMLAEGSIDGFRELVEAAEDMPVFHVRSILADADLTTPAGRDRALDESVGVVAGMGETISRDELMAELSERLRADPALVAKRVAGAGAGSKAGVEPSSPRAKTAPAAVAMTSRVRREQALLAMCIASPTEGQEILERLTPAHFSDPVGGRALEVLRSNLSDPQTGVDPSDGPLVSLIARLLASAERGKVEPGALDINLRQLEIGKLDDEIAAAAAKGDDATLVNLQRARAELK